MLDFEVVAQEPLVLSALSLEYVKARVVAQKNNVAYDPTADVVQLAFPVAGVAPVTGNWKAASWETDTDTLGTKQYWARCLVGPGGAVTLSAGGYDLWVKITDNPEIPVIKAGLLTVQ